MVVGLSEAKVVCLFREDGGCLAPYETLHEADPYVTLHEAELGGTNQ